MSLGLVLAVAIGIGVITGLRSMTGLAVVAWAARLGWIAWHGSWLGFLGSTWALYLFTALALAEFVADQLPSTPNRTMPGSLAVRALTAGICGAAICASAGQSVAIGAILAGAASIGGAFAGYEARHRLTARFPSAAIGIALVEDAIAVGGGFLIISSL
jgi:uncharacterized membrane protein